MKLPHQLIAASILWAMFAMFVAAQQPAVKSAEVKTYHLSLMASKKLDELNAAEMEIRKQFAIVQSQKAALYDGADVPLEARDHCVANKGLYVCVVPAPSPK